MKVIRHKCRKCGFVHEHIQGTPLRVTITKCTECGGNLERVIEKTDYAHHAIKITRSVSYTSPCHDKRPYEPDITFF
ncbi:hypothetical protein ACFL6F_00655 [Planctomycetota bacterium]